MARPSIDLDVQRRLMRIAREVDDELSPSPSHQEALESVLDHVEQLEENQSDSVEQLEELIESQERQRRDTLGTGIGNDSDGFM